MDSFQTIATFGGKPKREMAQPCTPSLCPWCSAGSETWNDPKKPIQLLAIFRASPMVHSPGLGKSFPIAPIARQACTMFLLAVVIIPIATDTEVLNFEKHPFKATTWGSLTHGFLEGQAFAPVFCFTRVSPVCAELRPRRLQLAALGALPGACDQISRVVSRAGRTPGCSAWRFVGSLPR